MNRKREHGWSILGLLVGFFAFELTSPYPLEPSHVEGLFLLPIWILVGTLTGAMTGILRDRPRLTVRPQFTVRQLLTFVYIAANLMFWWYFFWGQW